MKRVFIVGVAIWLVATIALRLGGQRMFHPERPWSIISLLAVSALLMFLLPRGLFSRFSIPQEQRALAGIALAAPGMFLDTVSAICFSSVFPNIRPDAAGLFGGWLLFCNVVALVSAATWGSKPAYGTADGAVGSDQ
jgi:Family of unknown function (DUF5367)